MDHDRALVLAGVLALSLGSPAHANLLTNGSFENQTAGAPDDWNPAGNLQVITTQGETDGVRSLAFSFANLPSNGVIWQAFPTTAGLEYEVDFDFGKYSVNQPQQVARLDVDVFDGNGLAGTQLLDQTVTDATPGAGDPDSSDEPGVMLNFKVNFVASSFESTLRFTDVSDPQVLGGGFDAMLDDVSVTLVPEPAGLLCFGFALLCRRGR